MPLLNRFFFKDATSIHAMMPSITSVDHSRSMETSFRLNSKIYTLAMLSFLDDSGNEQAVKRQKGSTQYLVHAIASLGV